MPHFKLIIYLFIFSTFFISLSIFQNVTFITLFLLFYPKVTSSHGRTWMMRRRKHLSILVNFILNYIFSFPFFFFFFFFFCFVFLTFEMFLYFHYYHYFHFIEFLSFYFPLGIFTLYLCLKSSILKIFSLL